MIFTSLSPNTERDDLWLACKLLFLSWKPKHGQVVKKLESAVGEYLNAKTFAVNNGRTALFALLKSIGIKPGDQVLLQAYTCVAVPEPVLWCGARPVYVDCDRTLTLDVEDFRKKITAKSKAVVVQHTFGSPAKIDEIIKIAKEFNLFVIEDCAHALGAEYKGKKVGTFGDASFFSFGRDKVISSVFGGLIATSNTDVENKLNETVADFQYPGIIWTKKQLLHPIILSISKPLYSFFSLGKIALAAARKVGLISLAVEQTEKTGGKPTFAPKRMPDALAQLALFQFKKLEKFNNHRRNIAWLYDNELTSIDRQVVGGEAKNIFLRYTIFVPDSKGLLRYAKKHGIELGDWYTEPIAPKNVSYEKVGYDRGCRQAEFYSAHSVNLPTHIQINQNDAKYVVKIVNEFLAYGSTRN